MQTQHQNLYELAYEIYYYDIIKNIDSTVISATMLYEITIDKEEL